MLFISLWTALSCFLAFSSLGTSLNFVRDDRQVGEAPFLELVVVLLGRGEADQVADRPGDDVVVADEVGLVLALLEGARQRGREIAADGRLFGYDERLRHG